MDLSCIRYSVHLWMPGRYSAATVRPGMVISTVALLNNNPEPTDEEIAMALDNNLCRCTGYKKILDAVHLAMQYIKEGKGEQDK